MAETRPGGVYKVGNRFVDANGNEVKGPTRAETAEQREADQVAEQQLQEAANAETKGAVKPKA